MFSSLDPSDPDRTTHHVSGWADHRKPISATHSRSESHKIIPYLSNSHHAAALYRVTAEAIADARSPEPLRLLI
jgi:Tfp pilus assembly protein PilX